MTNFIIYTFSLFSARAHFDHIHEHTKALHRQILMLKRGNLREIYPLMVKTAFSLDFHRFSKVFGAYLYFRKKDRILFTKKQVKYRHYLRLKSQLYLTQKHCIIAGEESGRFNRLVSKQWFYDTLFRFSYAAGKPDVFSAKRGRRRDKTK